MSSTETITSFFNGPIGIALVLSAILVIITIAAGTNKRSKKKKASNFGKTLVITTGFVGLGIIGLILIMAIWAALAGGTVVVGTWIAFGAEPSSSWQWALVIISAITLLLQLIVMIMDD